MRYKSIVSGLDNARCKSAQVSCALYYIRIILFTQYYNIFYILLLPYARILLLLPFNAVLYAVYIKKSRCDLSLSVGPPFTRSQADVNAIRALFVWLVKKNRDHRYHRCIYNVIIQDDSPQPSCLPHFFCKQYRVKQNLIFKFLSALKDHFFKFFRFIAPINEWYPIEIQTSAFQTSIPPLLSNFMLTVY